MRKLASLENVHHISAFLTHWYTVHSYSTLKPPLVAVGEDGGSIACPVTNYLQMNLTRVKLMRIILFGDPPVNNSFQMVASVIFER